MWATGEAEVVNWAYRGLAEFGVTVTVLAVVLGAFLWGLYLVFTRFLPDHFRKIEEERAGERRSFLEALAAQRAACREERNLDRQATREMLERVEKWATAWRGGGDE